VESYTTLIPLGPRDSIYDPVKTATLTKAGVQRLSKAAASCWKAIGDRDLTRYANAVQQSFNAQVALFPDMVTPEVKAAISRYPDALGFKLAGAGGGGYLVVIRKESTDDSIQLRVRRSDYQGYP